MEPINLVGPAKATQKNLVEPFPYTGLLPVAQSASASHATAAVHLLGKHLQRDADFEHKQDTGRGRRVVRLSVSAVRAEEVAQLLLRDREAKEA